MTVEDNGGNAGAAVGERYWQIAVDVNSCIGSGRCSHMAAAYFELLDEHSRVIDEIVAPNQPVLDAAESCPVEAITVSERGSGRLVAPQP